MNTVTVMTYNIKGHAAFRSSSHMQKIAEIIRQSNADVVGIQEVHRRSVDGRLHDQFADLEALTGLHAFFGRSFTKGGAEYGNVLLTRGRILDARTHPLPGGGEPRTLLSATVELASLKFNVLVTHLTAWGPFGRRVRLAQAETVAREAEKSTLPFVVTGDFNTGPSSKELQAFHRGGLVLSCFVDPIVTHRSTRQCLDYIFADTGWRILNSRVVNEGPSDHWPLVATLARNGQSVAGP